MAFGATTRAIVRAFPEALNRVSKSIDSSFGDVGTPISVPTMRPGEYSPGTAFMNTALAIFSGARQAANEKYAREELRLDREKGGLQIENLRQQVAANRALADQRGRAYQPKTAHWPGGYGLNEGDYDPATLGAHARMYAADQAARRRTSTKGGSGGKQYTAAAGVERLGRQDRADVLQGWESNYTPVMEKVLADMGSPDKVTRTRAYHQLGLLDQNVKTPDAWEGQFSGRQRTTDRQAVLNASVSSLKDRFRQRKMVQLHRMGMDEVLNRLSPERRQLYEKALQDVQMSLGDSANAGDEEFIDEGVDTGADDGGDPGETPPDGDAFYDQPALEPSRGSAATPAGGLSPAARQMQDAIRKAFQGGSGR